MQAKTATNPKPLHFGLIMVIYLCGIFMGAIDTSVVTPARTVIQNGLGVGDQTGIWMIDLPGGVGRGLPHGRQQHHGFYPQAPEKD